MSKDTMIRTCCESSDVGYQIEGAVRLYRASPESAGLQVRSYSRLTSHATKARGIVSHAVMNKAQLIELRDTIDAILGEL